MKIIRRIRNKFKYLFLKSIRPQTIGGFRNPNGLFFERSSVSNMTHISNKNNNLFIGENVFIGHFNYIDAYNAKVTISNNVQITNYVNILTHSSHHGIRLLDNRFDGYAEYPEILKVGDIYIGENSYIGPHSVLMPGTKLGKGTIVSAFSFVNGDFPDFAILRGQPARVIGDTRAVDKKLLEKYPELRETYYLRNEID